jgi:hypothetical protein
LYAAYSRLILRAELELQLAGLLLKDPKTPDVKLILCDIVEPKAPKGSKAICLKSDLCDPAEVKKLFATEFGPPDTV